MNVPLTATAKPLTADGKPARMDGVPTWKQTPADAGSISASADGLTAAITPPTLVDGMPVSVLYEFNGDGDQGDGVTPIHGSASVTFFDPASNAATVDITIAPTT
jgi:hypothetical protein